MAAATPGALFRYRAHAVEDVLRRLDVLDKALRILRIDYRQHRFAYWALFSLRVKSDFELDAEAIRLGERFDVPPVVA
jgi:hypothetical protein